MPAFAPYKLPTDAGIVENHRHIAASDDSGARRLYLAIRRLRLATVSGISGANGAVAEWLKAAVC
jgi:hypothetical protein